MQCYNSFRIFFANDLKMFRAAPLFDVSTHLNQIFIYARLVYCKFYDCSMSQIWVIAFSRETN